MNLKEQKIYEVVNVVDEKPDGFTDDLFVISREGFSNSRKLRGFDGHIFFDDFQMTDNKIDYWLKESSKVVMSKEELISMLHEFGEKVSGDYRYEYADEFIESKGLTDK